MKINNLRCKYAMLLLCVLVCVFLISALNLTSFAFAEEVSETRLVKLEYLKRIEGTPFAEKIQKVIKVPVYVNNEIKIADVKKELKCKTFGVMQSYCDGFIYDTETLTYTAVYNKSVYLSAKTVDGNSKNFYLDCNLSFVDYFSPFVNSGIMEKDAYEVFMNGIYLKYPVLKECDYTLDNLYGYFGVIPIPSTYTLNQLWADMFCATTYSGVLEHFKYNYVLTNEAYRKLLDDYHYGWLEVVWSGFWDEVFSGSANATYYMVYIDSETTEAFIAENGATDIDDNSGAIAVSAKNFFSNKDNIWGIVGVFLGLLLFAGMLLVIVCVLKSMAKSVSKNVTRNSKRKR